MGNLKIQKIWQHSYQDYSQSGHFQSEEQKKASHAILACKSGDLVSISARAGNAGTWNSTRIPAGTGTVPNCQAVLKEIWVDKRRAEVIDSLTSM